MPTAEPIADQRTEFESEVGYESLVANVWVGKKLYLKLDKTRIGVIAEIQSDHRFDDGTVRDGVLVDFKDGARFWLPRKTLQQLYVTR